jgi:hypothetical protein
VGWHKLRQTAPLKPGGVRGCNPPRGDTVRRSRARWLNEAGVEAVRAYEPKTMTRGRFDGAVAPVPRP